MHASESAILVLLLFIATEYGFLSRKAFWQRVSGRWPWRGTLIRVLAWAAVWMANGGLDQPRILVESAASFALGEAIVLVIRLLLRNAADGSGAPWIHLLPFLIAAVGGLLGHQLGMNGSSSFERLGRLLTILLGFVLMWNWGTVFTVSVVEISRPGQVEQAISPSVGPGEVIGILERLITLVLVVSGGLVAVGFVVATKAAVRFPLFKERAFAEYFLIGTLSSLGLATTVGLVLRGLLF
jgi:hypothetical protein